MNELRNIREDIKNHRFIESYLVLAMSLIILIADIFGFANTSIMNEIILATLSVILYVTVLERREFQKLVEKKDIESVTVFRPNRDSLPPLDKILSVAKKEIALYAVQHSTIVHQYLGLLESKARSGCRIKILMMAPRGPDGKLNLNVEEAESHRRYTGMRAQLESSIASFQTWLASLNPSTRERVEIRMYLQCPTASCTFIDREEIDGFVQVELSLYGIHVHDLPHYVVTRKQGGSFFDIHCESFNRLWAKSEVLTVA